MPTSTLLPSPQSVLSEAIHAVELVRQGRATAMSGVAIRPVKRMGVGRHLLRSGYEARNREELPVLVRWFEGVESPRANYLVVILYSAEQLAKEGSPIQADWGIVGCIYTAEPEEVPMAPITMMRNALGVEEGGSGVPLDREAYQRAVQFWEGNANWRP